VSASLSRALNYEGQLVTSVDAQWALHGKTLGREGYRVLACSTGSLTVENFTDAIGRFSMGTPEKLPNALPQVTISRVKIREVNHVALAIHQLAADAYPDGQVIATDDDGRAVVATRYYCVPYEPTAEQSVSYRGMYEAFSVAPLPLTDGPVLPIELPVAPAAPDPAAIDPLAVKAAALLLTGRPLCVLGATLQTSMTDRLGFIDTVMSLLPYGFRTRMTAATWTRATNQDHLFRLFFSGAPRDVKHPDNVVFWGHPEQTHLSRDDTYAYDYLNWLRTGPVADKLSLLAGLTRSRSLTIQKEVLEALDAVEEIAPATMPLLRSRASYRPRPGTEPDRSANGSGPVQGTSAAASSEVEQLLMDCGRYMDSVDSQRLAVTISKLREMARFSLGEGERDRCRERIREYRLFRHSGVLGQDEETLREILLQVAFESPLSYEDYCLIEDAAGETEDEEGKEKNLDASLLRLIDKREVADERVKAITYRQLTDREAAKKLSAWYGSKDLSAERVIGLLTLEVRRPRHMKLLCDVTVDYLLKMSRTYVPKDIDRVLRRHSYLARHLQDSLPGEDQYQLDALGSLLTVAYPNGITQADLYHVLIGTDEPVTLPFLGAVVLLVADPADTFLARELYLHSAFSVLKFNANTRRELEKLIISVLEEHSPQFLGSDLERRVLKPMPADSSLPGAPTRLLSAREAVARLRNQPPPPQGNARPLTDLGGHRAGRKPRDK
jgi:hypothetical protein